MSEHMTTFGEFNPVCTFRTDDDIDGSLLASTSGGGFGLTEESFAQPDVIQYSPETLSSFAAEIAADIGIFRPGLFVNRGPLKMDRKRLPGTAGQFEPALVQGSARNRSWGFRGFILSRLGQNRGWGQGGGSRDWTNRRCSGFSYSTRYRVRRTRGGRDNTEGGDGLWPVLSLDGVGPTKPGNQQAGEHAGQEHGRDQR